MMPTSTARARTIEDLRRDAEHAYDAWTMSGQDTEEVLHAELLAANARLRVLIVDSQRLRCLRDARRAVVDAGLRLDAAQTDTEHDDALEALWVAEETLRSMQMCAAGPDDSAEDGQAARRELLRRIGYAVPEEMQAQRERRRKVWA